MDGFNEPMRAPIFIATACAGVTCVITDTSRRSIASPESTSRLYELVAPLCQTRHERVK